MIRDVPVRLRDRVFRIRVPAYVASAASIVIASFIFVLSPRA